jgi:hypothetical protein
VPWVSVDPRRSRHWRDLVVDCARPAPLARFWAAALHWPPPTWDEEDLSDLHSRGITDTEDDPAVFIDSGDPALPRICFQRVPEAGPDAASSMAAKPAKNRVHIDVNVADLDEVDVLVVAGARVLARHPAHDGGWVVLADPEGNEFCAILH